MIARELAAWALGEVDIPETVRTAAKRHLLDGLGTALAAVRTGAGTPATTVARGLGGPGEATILGTSDRVSAPAAALANGTLVHALDFDDTHAGGLVHATSVVLPAALAVGEERGATGEQVLTAAVVGYEAVCRIAAAAPHGFHSRGLHATMVAGVFSSALVAARLMGLDAERATHALGIAGSQAGGLLAFLGTEASTKQLHPGFASQAGIIAARLAEAGATGPATVFDGPHSVYDAMAAGTVDRSAILAELGTRWETTNIGIKPWPACQLSHATIAAVRQAMATESFDAAQVAAVHAIVHPDSASVVCDTSRDLTRPASPYAAKFSLPWCVAAVLIDGDLGVDTFAEQSLTRPEITALASKVTWELTPSPKTVAADAPGEVTITLTDGRRITGHVERSPGGGPAPLSQEALVTKFETNLGRPAPELVRSVMELDAAPDLATLIRQAAAAVAGNREDGD
ncbi:MAG: MmgE/PrpD family protein [Actinobacteria bacterium]|nr:MAG: MmgE/PrpD family protein [Actinomycetota bacterium]